ncbi:hypothetical protein LWI28_003053 [Acer negundo]|uniref:Uncharacterized protein n=1 Tax=Acer negundo TaxID=4023 RepID=A0AAD5NPN7_ACENE|nr:hypothetical protein LWI28_003053 [Acer negundo]KAK4846870.1 hypothetical protein QYF36_022824 [Acer negundo]
MGNCWSPQNCIREPEVKESAEASFRNIQQYKAIIDEDRVADTISGNYLVDEETGDILMHPRISLRVGGLEAIPEEPSTDVETGSTITNVEEI